MLLPKRKLSMLHHTKVAEGTSTLGQTFNLTESTLHNMMKNANKIHSDMIQFTSLTAMATMHIRNPAVEKGEMLSPCLEHKTRKKICLSNI